MALRSTATATSSTGGNLTATPAGVQSGDYLSGFFSSDAGTPVTSNVVKPTGWTEQVNKDTTLPDGQYFRYADKVATGSDSFTWTNSETFEAVLIAASHSGRSGTTSFITATQVTTAQSSPITEAATGGTAIAGDDLIAYYGEDVSGFSSPFTHNAASGPGTFTKQQDLTGGVGHTSSTLSTLDNYAGGATGNVTVTATGAGSTAGWVGVIVAVKAAANTSIDSALEVRSPFLRMPTRVPFSRKFIKPSPQIIGPNDSNIVPIPNESVIQNRSRFGWSPSHRPMARRMLRASAADPNNTVVVASTIVFRKTLSSVGTKTGSHQTQNS